MGICVYCQNVLVFILTQQQLLDFVQEESSSRSVGILEALCCFFKRENK